MINNISGKKILITGGTGSLGVYIIHQLLNMGAKNIISLSNDKNLIKKAKEIINSPYVTFLFGDICDNKIGKILKNVNYVYHTAAVKDIYQSELSPTKTFNINVLGTVNILHHSKNVERFVFISSDKAIEPVSCYGASKLLGEYFVKEKNTTEKGDFIVVRCPNFLGSRRSVLDLWGNKIKENDSIEVTDPEMTRFFITLPDAAKFIINTSLSKKIDGEKIYYPHKYVRKFKLKDLAKAYAIAMGKPLTRIKIIGAKAGEKTHETYMKNVPLVKVSKLVNILKKHFQDNILI